MWVRSEEERVTLVAPPAEIVEGGPAALSV
jgi:hypothetical protein